MRIGLVNTVLLALATALTGCANPEACTSLGKCGGNFLAGAQDHGGPAPSAEWVAVSTDACIDQVPNPPNPASLTRIPPRPAGVRAVEPSTVDWCNGLVLSKEGVKDYDDGWAETLKQFSGWFPSVPLYTAQIEFFQGPNGQSQQYSLTTTQLVTNHADLSATCMVGQGVKLTCDEFNGALKVFLEKRFSMINGLKARVYDNKCGTTPEGGCSCDYDLELTSSSAGPWNAPLGTGQISFFDFAAAPPSQADYCLSGGTLSLSGTKGADLFNRSTLETLRFRAPSCTDHVQSKTLGETGIDCGGTCPNACP